MYCLNNLSKYSLHHNILEAATKADEICGSQLENYISQRENRFNTDNQGIQNLATGA